jgi:hypothetical protein
MKKFILIVFLFISVYSNGQSVPQRLNYQAVARNSSGNILSNQALSIKIDILDTDLVTELYSERHVLTTNQFGLFTLLIGNGAVLSGQFSSIAWGSGSKHLRTSIDLTSGTNYQVMGITQLVSVPYALYSWKADSLKNASMSNVNTSLGVSAFNARQQITGARNTSVGAQSLMSHTLGLDNSALGYGSLASSTTSSRNTAIGSESLNLLTTTTNNVAIGYRAGYNNIGSSNVFIGSNSANNSAFNNVSNKLIISNSPTDNPFMLGDFSTRTLKINAELDSAVIYNKLRFNDADANSHIATYENDIAQPLIYARYFYGHYGDLVIQGLSKTYTGNIHFVTGSTVPGASSPTQRMVIMDNGKVGIGNFAPANPPRAKLEIQSGDVYLSDNTKGVILTAPNGTCWRVTVDNSGNLVRTSTPCPTY